MSPDEAFVQGRQAYMNALEAKTDGREPVGNPFKLRSKNSKRWKDGWFNAWADHNQIGFAVPKSDNQTFY